MTEYDPTFIDGDGNEVHIGDSVSWLTDASGNTTKTKSAPVEGINYKLTQDGTVKAWAKLRNRTQAIAVEKLSLIDGSTLGGVLHRVVADANGYLDESAYEAAVAEIEALFGGSGEDTPPDGDSSTEEPTAEGGEG